MMSCNFKNLAIIPARGGSKRIPSKNIRDFCGQPIIAYPITVAKSSGIFDRVIVSTDSIEIGKISERYGADVPFIRPKELADDHTDTDAVVLHFIDWVKSNWGQPDYICCIYPTAIFLKEEYLKKGFDILKRNKAISAFSVTSFSSCIFRALQITKEGRIKMFWPEYRKSRSQDLPMAYHDAGQFYWIDARKYVVEGKLFSSDSVPVVIPNKFVQDIDTLEDWERAENMFKLLSSEEK